MVLSCYNWVLKLNLDPLQEPSLCTFNFWDISPAPKFISPSKIKGSYRMENEKFLPNFIVCYATQHDLGPLAFFGGISDLGLSLLFHAYSCMYLKR